MKKWIISACLLMMQAGAWAKVTLPDIMSDNMVLQQQTEACLWGKANANAEVTIRPSWNRETYKVTAGADGKWIAKIKMPPMTSLGLRRSDHTTILRVASLRGN